MLTFPIIHSIVFLKNTTNKRRIITGGEKMDNAALGALTEKLVPFGLTRQEAAIYLCLLGNSELSGYEVSKLTGI